MHYVKAVTLLLAFGAIFALPTRAQEKPTPIPQSRIAYISQQEGSREWVYIMNADGTDSQVLYNRDELGVGVYNIACSKDGEHVAITLPVDRIGIVNTKTFEHFMFKLPGLNVYSGTGIDWSPNNEELLLSIEGDLYVVNIDGTQLRAITNTPYGEHDAVWSPDGQQIAANITMKQSDGTYQTGIYILDGDGQNPRLIKLLEANSRELIWSTDGQWLYRWEPNTETQISNWVALSVNTQARSTPKIVISVSSSQGIVDGRLSPDGSQILYTLNDEEYLTRDIYVMDADGTNVRRLTNRYGHDRSPCWLP